LVGSVRRAGLGLALPALVGASTLIYWLAGRRIAGLWIMPDEAIYADRAITLWRHGSLTVLNGEGAGYSVLYPLVAGLPLSVGSIGTGYASLKLLQALVMSLTAVPMVVYGRRLMPTGYALFAGALALASPILLYSGFVMTEVLYYLLATLALLGVTRAVESASKRDQLIALFFIGLAILTRVQAVVLVAVFAAAILLDALLGRDRRRLPAFWPVWLLLGLVAAAAALKPGVFGAYAGTLNGSYPVAESVRFVYYHAAYAILMVAIAPIAALVVLLVEAARGRERDRSARALIAVATCAYVLVTVQVGSFAARYAPHLLGRDLAALPPILFLVFALWLSRGAPRPRIVASLTIVAILAALVGAPWNTLVSDVAVPDTMGIAIVHHSYWGLSPASIVAVGAAVILVLVRFTPRRSLPILGVVVLATLAVSTALASNLVAPKVRSDQLTLVGHPRTWIDDSVHAPVALVYDGNETGNVVWHQKFWNRRIAQLISISPATVLGPIKQTQVRLDANGDLPTHTRYAAANDQVTIIGTPVVHQDRGPDSYGMTLWKLEGRPRVSMIENSIKPNGDMIGPAQITVFDCAGGQLQLTLLPKASDHVLVFLDGKRVLRQPLSGDFWNGAVNVPPSHTAKACQFAIRGGLLLGSTRIAFERPS
jgi:Dolichyl-phosphate-mannose-protein mannosyltransferase